LKKSYIFWQYEKESANIADRNVEWV